MDPKGLVLVGVVAMVALSGCVGSHAPAAAGERSTGASSSATNPFDDPNLNETSQKTIVKIGKNVTQIGREHFHNYWGDGPGARTSYVIFDADLPTSDEAGVCAGVVLVFACQNGPDGAHFVRFHSSDDDVTPPNNVWPGTGKMTIDITMSGGSILKPFDVAVSAPHRPGWSKERYTVSSTPVTVTVPNILENQTDPPHNRDSSWVFRIETHKGDGDPAATALYTGQMHWKITIYRSDRPLPLDPAHPDFWGTATQLPLVEFKGYQKGQFVNGGFPVYTLWRWTSVWPPKNTTVFPLTHKLVATLEWTNNVTMQPPLMLGYCDVHQQCYSTGTTFSYPKPTTDVPGKRTYEMLLRSDQWDSPYVNASGWRFRWDLDNGEPLNQAVAPTGVFDGTVKFEAVIYKLT